MMAELKAGEPADWAAHIALSYGNIDGDHHKMWVIDQMLRMLLGLKYEEVIAIFNAPNAAGEQWEWDTGIAP